MSATPRTDAVTFDIQITGDAWMDRVPYLDGQGDYVEAEHAKQLETELAAAIAERDRAKLAALDSDRAHDARVTECERQADVIAALKAERDALARRVAELEGGK